MLQIVVIYSNWPKMMIRILTVIVVVFLLTSCSKVPKIIGFDATLWQQDQFGCDGNRLKLSGILEAQRQQLKLIEEPELKKILGSPNSVEIMQRQQRYYIYWIQNPAKCADSAMAYKELRIRVSALGKVTEVLF